MAELLRRERERRGHSQAAVAEKTGMNQRTLSKWESGDTPEQIEWLRNLARYYGVSVSYLLEEKEAPPSHEERAAAELIAQLPASHRARLC